MHRAILVLEDEDVVRDFIVRALASEGHDVLTADTVRAAREIIFARPDADNLCLVIDVVLQHESGIEFAQELIQRYPGFRVLLISGYTDDVLLTEPDDVASRMGFLPKPFTKQDLVAAVENVCG